MSTYYKRPKEPISSVRVSEHGSHADITIWINHALAGVLTVRAEELNGFLQNVIAEDAASAQISNGRLKRFTLIDDDEYFISEYGDVLSGRELVEAAVKND